jgi:hypothetical protein
MKSKAGAIPLNRSPSYRGFGAFGGSDEDESQDRSAICDDDYDDEYTLGHHDGDEDDELEVVEVNGEFKLIPRAHIVSR